MSAPATRMNDLIPATSPLLRPSDRHRNSADSFSLSAIRNDDIPEDLEFLAPGTWSDTEQDGEEDSDSDGEDSIEDFSLEDGHIAGVPSCSSVFQAKQYHTSEFHASLLELLRDDLRVLGWANLPADLPASLIHIHKVSGSLTNAVFFVSIPATDFEINADGAARPLTPPEKPATVLSELERGRATPTPAVNKTLHEGEKITIEAPTLLLRIYGPSSGSLISRRTELHILHTLSSKYAIGPRVLGTFANGRVEEYFHSRALHKEEMRDARISRWIGRRMRELHRVELDQMEPPNDGRNSRDGSRSRSGSEAPERPSLENMGQGSNRSATGGSSSSIYSTSSGSSIFSFGTSYSAASSRGSFSSARGGSSSDLVGTLTDSPLMMPQRYPSESRAQSKKRSRSSLVLRGRRSKDKLGVWENITRWTREAKLVLKALDDLAQTPGFEELLAASTAAAAQAKGTEEPVIPLASLARTLELRAQVDLPLFEQQIKLYRTFVRDWERTEGKSKRVFAHNDTQYGNLLLLTPADESKEAELERSLQAPHQKIIVVDFEYASANPRAFDIANHFIEWQADYHHPALSHSLSAHRSYPSVDERARFLRAYVGCDGGLDTSEPDPAKTEDARVQRLEDEVKIWEPSSHAMWAVWGIVQGKEDLLAQVEKWKKACAKKVSQGQGLEKGVKDIKLDDGGKQGRPALRRGKSGEVVDSEGNEVDVELAEEEEIPVVDFDYMSYARERIALFREDAGKLGIL